MGSTGRCRGMSDSRRDRLRLKGKGMLSFRGALLKCAHQRASARTHGALRVALYPPRPATAFCGPPRPQSPYDCISCDAYVSLTCCATVKRARRETRRPQQDLLDQPGRFGFNGLTATGRMGRVPPPTL